jgi:hypothetical protein
MKNKCVPFVLFFLVVIISAFTVDQKNMALANEPDSNLDDSAKKLREFVKHIRQKRNPYRPFAATWPNSDGLLLEIHDGSGRSPYIYSIDELSGDGAYRHYKSFITSTINYLSSTLLNGENFDKKGVAGDREVKVVFVRKELTTSKYDEIAVVPASLIPEGQLSCWLESPWLKLDVQRSPVLRIHAVFFWNEQQFLIDQAILSGVPASDFTAIDSEVKDLSRLLDRPPFVSRAFLSDRARFTTGHPDASYLFIRMNTLNDHMVKHYPKLIQILFDQCFLSEQYVLQRYKTILDIRDVVPLDEYQFKRIPKN